MKADLHSLQMPTQNFGVSWSTKPPSRHALHCGRQRLFKQHHYKRFIRYLLLCFITQAPLRRILTTFSFGITVQYLQLRVSFGRKHTGRSKSEKDTFGRLSHKIIPVNNSLIIEEQIRGCLWTIFDKMAPEETDFERNPAQKQFRVTTGSPS